MNRIIAILIITFFSLAIISCEKGFNINDDYSVTTIVYGLIDPTDSISYLRIQKSFLTEGDAFEAAQIADSNLFPYKFDVKLRAENGDIVVTFDTITIYNKNEGFFYSPKTLVYYAVTKDLLNDSDVYTLEINNPKNGKQVSAKSQFIDGSKLNIDFPNQVIHIDANNKYSIGFNSIKNARLYSANIRFHYKEEHIETGDSAWSYVDWTLPPILSSDLNGDEELRIYYYSNDFYSNLKDNILINEKIIRKEGQVELTVFISDETFHYYLAANDPSTSLIVVRPDYTNIENGLGIFASRSKKTIFTKLNASSHATLIGLDSLNFENW